MTTLASAPEKFTKILTIITVVHYGVIFLVAGIISWIGTGLVRRWLISHQILDQPNNRSSHSAPVPRGGGLAVVLTIAIAAVTLSGSQLLHREFTIILIASVVLAVLSFWDDRQGLPIWIRLLAQGIAVVGGVLVLPDVGVFQGWLPLPVDRLLAAILWLWFINLYNFMDGIDGIAAVETIFLGFGIALLAGSSLIGGYATAISGAAFGFLFWNRPPAKIFLGDVGSVPLGYILGYLLLLLATQGSWAAALILPMYYLVDATVTLMIRLIDGQKIWLAHREHAYQRAVQRGLSHGAVTTRIALCNSVLVVLAGLTMQFTTFTKMTLVAAALGWCLVFWWRLRGRSR